MNIIQTIKKYPKDSLLVLAVILVGILAVSSDGFSDLAKKKGWWTFWEIVQVLSILACIGGYIYLRKKEKDFKE